MLHTFEMEITAEGPEPEGIRATAEAASPALEAAADAAKVILESHGFQVVRHGYGVRPTS